MSLRQKPGVGGWVPSGGFRGECFPSPRLPIAGPPCVSVPAEGHPSCGCGATLIQSDLSLVQPQPPRFLLKSGHCPRFQAHVTLGAAIEPHTPVHVAGQEP